MGKHSAISDFTNIYNNYIIKNTISYNGSDFTCQLIEDNFEISKSILNQIFNKIDGDLPDFKVSFKFTDLKIINLKIFYKQINFLKNKDYLDDFENLMILILEDDKVLFKDLNKKFSKENAIIYNNYTYQKILIFLKESKNFTSLKSNDNEFIVISKENSVMNIGYKNLEPRLEHLDNIFPEYLLLKKRFEKTDLQGDISENVEFIKLFIENISISGFGNNKEKKEDSLFEIIKGLKIIISLTERDYDNYINNFSFEKIKAKFKDERNKYFDGLEKNIELISKQVVSFPLTFAATAFASYQVKDKEEILILIFIAYALYTFIAFRILKISSYNIECLEKDIVKEEEDIINNFNKNYSDFEDDFIKIKKKTNKIKELVCYLKLIVISMLALFFCFMVYQVFFSKKEFKNETITIPVNKINFIQIDSLKLITNDKLMLKDSNKVKIDSSLIKK